LREAAADALFGGNTGPYLRASSWNRLGTAVLSTRDPHLDMPSHAVDHKCIRDRAQIAAIIGGWVSERLRS
jgi:hypothetical protein